MKKKLENFWYYYKWYVLGGLLLLILLADFLIQRQSIVKPDYEVAVVTVAELSEKDVQALAERLGELLAVEGGKVPIVRVNVYRYDGNAMAAEDTAQFMAASVQLAADLQESISLCYISDVPKLLLDADARLSTLCQTDNTRLSDMETLAGFALLCREDALDTVNRLLP